MVSYNSSRKIPQAWGRPQTQQSSKHNSLALDQFVLADSSTGLLHARRQHGKPCFCSLTALGQQMQQPFQQQLQPLLGSIQPSSNRVATEAPTGRQSRQKGLINIGLNLVQSTTDPGDTQPGCHLLAAQTATHYKQQPQQKQQPAAATKTNHRQQQKQQQQQQQQQPGCLLEAATAPAGSNTEQQQQHQQPGQQRRRASQQDTSGPVASWLTGIMQAKLLVAGAASAIVSRTAMAPLERVKMDLLLKTSSRSAVDTALWVWQREGLAGFWKGNGLNLLRTAPFKALNFFSFDVYSKALSNVMTDGSNSARFLAGAMAGITATLVCFPLDVLRTRLMAPWGHKYGGPLTTLRCMVKFEGPGALYAGVLPAVIGMAPSGAVFYGVYDLLKARHLAALAAACSTDCSSSSSTNSNSSSSVSSSSSKQQHACELPVLYSLLYGALAGAAAETFLYPLEVIRRKMQLQSMAAGAAAVLAPPGSAAAAAAAAGKAAGPGMMIPFRPPNAAGALRPMGAQMGGFGPAGVPGAAAVGRVAAACAAIIKADGVAGFYAGLLPNMLQVLPSAALSYGTYESVKQVLGAV